MKLDHPHFQDKTPAHIAYALMAISVFTGFPVFIAAIVAWINRSRETDPLLSAHYGRIIRTFWINLLIAVIGLGLTLVFIGYIILVLNQIWLIYRVATGWYRFTHDQLP